MTTAGRHLAVDASGLPIHEGDRVGSFRRTDPGTAVGIEEDHYLMVIHDGDRHAFPTAYLIGAISRSAPGLFVLNVGAIEESGAPA